jgi:hypothetical protein
MAWHHLFYFIIALELQQNKKLENFICGSATKESLIFVQKEKKNF